MVATAVNIFGNNTIYPTNRIPLEPLKIQPNFNKVESLDKYSDVPVARGLITPQPNTNRTKVQQIASKTEEKSGVVKFYQDMRSGLVFAVSGSYAGIIVNKSAGVSATESNSIIPGTFGKDVAIIPINNLNTSDNFIVKTGVQIGLNEAMAHAGILAAHRLQKTRLPITAPTGTTKGIIYLASALVPISIEGNKSLVERLRSEKKIDDSGKPGTRVQDWYQWGSVYVPEAAGVGFGVGASVATTLTYNNITDALNNRRPIDAGGLVKAGFKGKSFLIPFFQYLVAKAVVSYPGADNSPTVDGVVNGVTGQALFDLSKRIFADPKQRAAVNEIKQQEIFRKERGDAAGDARYGTKQQQAARNAETLKLEAAANKRLSLEQKLKNVSKNVSGSSPKYGRSILAAVALEALPHYLSVEQNLNSRIHNRNVEDMSRGQAADTVKAINDVLKNPLVKDGEIISNSLIKLGKLISKDFSKVALWGSPSFINNLNAKKAQIYQKYPNLDLNTPISATDSSDKYSSAGAAYKPQTKKGDEGTDATQRANTNTNNELDRIKKLEAGTSPQATVIENAIRNIHKQLPSADWKKPTNDARPTNGQLDRARLTTAKKIETMIQESERYRAEVANRNARLAAPLDLLSDAAQRKRDDSSQRSQSSSQSARNASNHPEFNVMPGSKPITAGTGVYQSSVNNEVVQYLRGLVSLVDVNKPNVKGFKGEAIASLSRIAKGLTAADIQKILKAPVNQPIDSSSIRATRIGYNSRVTNLGDGIILVSTGIRNSNNGYVSFKLSTVKPTTAPAK